MRERFEEEPDTTAVFRDLAEVMCIRGYILSGEDCKRKFNALQQVFRRIYDMSGKNKDSLARTGQGGNTWPYYEAMLKLHVGDVTAVAPVTVAAGSTASLRRAEKRQDHELTTKGRPSSALGSRQALQKEKYSGDGTPAARRGQNESRGSVAYLPG